MRIAHSRFRLELEETRGHRKNSPLLALTDYTFAFLAAFMAALYAATAVTYIAAYSWRQLLFDQFRQYLPLLRDSFPGNLLVLENGHRPVFPNLVRHADVVLGGADQTIPIASGLAMALSSLALVSVGAWRTKSLALSERWAVVLLAAVAIFWLGNSRMLLHANEAIQVHMATLAVIVSGICAWRAAGARPMAWMAAGALAAFVATFSFGAGIAAFPALLLLGVMQRVEWRALALAAALFVMTLVLYLFVLPGDEGVRSMLSLRPIDSALSTARWLSGPLVNGWLGLSEPAAGNWLRGTVATHGPGPWLVASADWAAARAGGLDFVQFASATVGALGLATATALALARVRRPRPLGLLEAQSFALMLFGAAVGVLIGMARLEYFDENPSQVFADRYGVWPCLFWLGLGSLLVIRFASRAPASLRRTMPVLILTIAALAWPSHLGYRGWGVAVYRNAERGAAAIAMDVRDAAYLPAEVEVARPLLEQSIELLRQRRLSMFSTRSSAWLGMRAPLRVGAASVPARAGVRTTPIAIDAGRRVMSFEGALHAGIPHEGFDELFVVDAQQRVVGLGRWSFDARPVEPGWIPRPQWTGFDGYLRAGRDCAPLTLVGLRGTQAEALSRFAPCTPP